MEKERLQLHLLYFLSWSMHGTNLGLQTDIVKVTFYYINYLDAMFYLARTSKQYGIFLIPHSKSSGTYWINRR